MTLFVHTTDRCNEEAENYGQQQVLKNLKTNIEHSQQSVGFASLYGSAYLKKDLARNFRLIAYQLLEGGDQLLVLATILKRGDAIYGELLESAKRSNVPHSRLVTETDEDLRLVLDERRSQPDAPEPLPPPTADETGWLYPFSGISQQTPQPEDIFVLETRAWVVAIQSETVQEGLMSLHKVLEDAAANPEKLHAEGEAGLGVFEQEGVGFRYAYYPTARRLLLVRPVLQGQPAGGEAAAAVELREAPPEETLQRRALRSYPLFMTLDYESWSQIQKDDEANLALSPEEAELLDSIRHQEKGFPLFINGRAGSGKSTMLHYLAAELVEYGIRSHVPARPLFITFTPELQSRAQDTMKRLLLKHYQRLLDGLDPEEVEEALESSCVVFKDHLLNSLPPELASRFNPAGYVDYSRFTRLWETQFSRRQDAHRFSLEVSWHILRSHIKGARSDFESDLDPAEYAALGKRRRSVTQDTYTDVYNEVWKGWYWPLCKEQGLWDDQDLAAAALHEGINLSVHPAVFCDEAQDFTPLELQILIRLCLFSQRTLQPEQLGNVPIAFAGDPLQTINPTGFQWEAVKAEYHQALQERLDPYRRVNIEFNYKELDFNYRSTEEIVGFCNLIQLLRVALFEHQVRPQRAWDDARQAALPSLLSADSARVQEQILRRPDLAKIIPCQLGQESEYVAGDELLRKLPKDEKSGVYHNVFSPMRAKGLEFENVLLYRFADSAPEGISELLDSLSPPSEPEEGLGYQYFLNNLYVAASRAREELHVVDGEHQIRNFWIFATDQEIVRALLERVDGLELWEHALKFPAQPAPEEWGGEPVDPANQARSFEQTGREQRDPYLLRQAILSYLNAKMEAEAERCRALAYEYEDRLDEAGDVYRSYEVGMKKNAFRCYWRGRHWKRLVDLSAELPSRKLESRAADFMVETGNEAADDFVDLLSRTADDEAGWLQSAAADPSWQEVFRELLRRLASSSSEKDMSRVGVYSQVNRLIARLEKRGLQLDPEEAAVIAFHASRFRRARSLFEIAGSDTRKEYFVARAETTEFPESIRWWKLAGQPDRVLAIWREAEETVPTDPELVAAITSAALEETDLDASLRLCRISLQTEHLVKVVLKALEFDRHDVLEEASELLVDAAVRDSAWDLVLDLGRCHVRGRSLQQAGVCERLVRAIVQRLARSAELSSAENRDMADFLEEVARSTALDVREIGAAMERTRHFVKSLRYYEGLLNREGVTVADQSFAKERMVKVNEKYASFLESKGEGKAATDRRQKLVRLERAHGKTAANLTEYPTLSADQVPVGDGQAMRTQWSAGALSVRTSPSRQRIHATYDGIESFTVDVGEGGLQVTSSVEYHEIEKLKEDVAAWRIDAWHTTIRLRVSRGRYRAIVLSRNAGQATLAVS